MSALPYAEDVNYWKTGRSAPDVWLDRAKREIEKAGGRALGEGFGSDATIGRSAYMLAFELGGDRFKVVWPVLPSRSEDERAARVQAATMLYHDVKARCVSAKVRGARAAFFSYLLLPDGRTAVEASVPELADAVPEWLGGRRALPDSSRS